MSLRKFDDELANRVRFHAVAIETVGAFGPSAREFIDDIAEKIKSCSGDAGARPRLYRRVAAAVQTRNYACVAEADARAPLTRKMPRYLVIFNNSSNIFLHSFTFLFKIVSFEQIILIIVKIDG